MNFARLSTMTKVRIIENELREMEQYPDKHDYCSTCNKLQETKQVERDEVCIAVCAVCDSEIVLPF